MPEMRSEGMNDFGPGARMALHGVEVVPPAPEPVVPHALGPGDNDPRSEPIGIPAPAPKALGPGDDDPRSQPRGVAAPIVKQPGPGDEDPKPVDRGHAAPVILQPGPGDGPEADFDMLVPRASGPGSPDMPVRRITVFPKKQAEAAPVVEAVTVDNAPRRERRRSTQ